MIGSTPKTERNVAVVDKYVAGATIRELAKEYGISLSRISQILQRAGVTYADSARASLPKERTARRDERHRQKYGISLEERIAIRQQFGRRPFRAFQVHKTNAKKRGITFHLTFAQWWKLWQDSGKWDQVGRAGGCYVMSRYGDRGPYAAGNVRIITSNENHLEHHAARKTRENRGH